MDNLSFFLSVMPQHISDCFGELDDITLMNISEIRIRLNKPLIIYVHKKMYFLTGNALTEGLTPKCITVSESDIKYITDRLCNNSYHTKMNSMINGYITTEGGSRIGIGASAVYKNGKVSSVKDITSLSVRISHSCKNCSRKILDLLYRDFTPSIIVAGEPSSGKTTCLKDMARLLSGGYNSFYKRVSVVDERYELSAGRYGINIDYITGYEKAKGIEIATRTLSPEIIICDEIGNIDELNAIKYGFSTGVRFIVSAHMKSYNQIFDNKIIDGLIDTNEFDYIVILKNYTDSFDIIDLRADSSENSRNINDNYFFNFPWDNDGNV